MQTLRNQLTNSRFIHAIDTSAVYGSAAALPLLQIDAPFCRATLLLQGAQLLQFQPATSAPWLWLSPYAQFENGKSPRGGIPVCLPWFGVNRADPQKPKHGFARNRNWQLHDWQETDETVQLTLTFDYAGDEPALFATSFIATLVITLSTHLDMVLSIHNTSTSAAEFSWALHSYLAVDDCTHTLVKGLQGITYLDNTQGLKAVTSDTPVQFTQEVDRVYNHTTAPQQLQSTQPLVIDGDHCPTCIVWNAGETLAASMADIRDSYRGYVCIERGCAFADSLTLQGGEVFRAEMRIRPG